MRSDVTASEWMCMGTAVIMLCDHRAVSSGSGSQGPLPGKPCPALVLALGTAWGAGSVCRSDRRLSARQHLRHEEESPWPLAAFPAEGICSLRQEV